MKRFTYFGGGSIVAMALLLAGPAYAQNTASEATEVEEVVVTGSLIRGTPEDAALPVDVIGQEELQKQGSPTTVELLKALPVSNGVLGDTNQFDSRAQGSEGSGSVNLRGLGPQRTLVLLNGRRMPANPFGLAGAGVVDTNMIPSAAIGRIEVLKDGAAATYGSDAIGGVVNFITRENFDGLEVSGSYRFIEGSDGDYTLGLIAGRDFGDSLSVMVSAGYQHRSELNMRERDWAIRPYTENPEGGWSAAGNPSSFISLANSRRFRDPQCEQLGGFAGFSGTPGPSPLGITPVCFWNYTGFDNLVEEEDRYQLYGEVNYDFNDDTRLHVEGLYGNTDVPHWRTSPSYALLAGPNTATNPLTAIATLRGQYVVPNTLTPLMGVTNPTIAAFAAANPTIVTYNPALDPGAVGAFTTQPTAAVLAAGALVVASRPFAIGGNPMFDQFASEGERTFELYRFSGDLSGKITDSIGYTVSLTYGKDEAYRSGYDTVVSRYQLALRGLGGEGCNPTTGTAGVGPCQFFNPFSTAVAENVLTGQTNPTFLEAQNNDADLARWFFQKTETTQSADQFVAEAVINSTIEGWRWNTTEDAAWAFGVQFRKQTYETEYNDLTDRAITPCVDTVVNGNTTCANPTGPFAFLGVGSEDKVEQDLYAIFAELYMPFTDRLNATLAGRLEDYGGATGSTFNPKLSVRWQATDAVGFRGSVGSTFRAPPPTSLTDDFITSLQGIAGVFRAVDIYGDPDLQPETAMTYSVGVILDVGGLNATVDYWSFDFQDPITTDPVGAIAKAIFPNGQALPNNCDPDLHPETAPLLPRFTFTGGTCNTTNIERLRVNTVNGADVKTSGVDLLADYDFGDVGFGEFRVGTSITYVIEYKTDATFVEGVLVAEPFDAVGQLNYQTTAYPLPQWKGNIYAEWEYGPHNLRWTIRYIDGYTDQRVDPFKAGAYRLNDLEGTPFTLTAGKEIDSFLTHDLTYRVFLPMDTTAVVSVENVLDEEPPFARLDLNYDPFTANGLGRTVKVNVTKRF